MAMALESARNGAITHLLRRTKSASTSSGVLRPNLIGKTPDKSTWKGTQSKCGGSEWATDISVHGTRFIVAREREKPVLDPLLILHSHAHLSSCYFSLSGLSVCIC